VTHAELIERGVDWLKRQRGQLYSSQVILTEFHSFASEIPDIIGFSHHNTVVIECKTSLSDFRADQKKEHRHPLVKSKLGNHRFYLCPANLIAPDLIPEGWGLLYCHPGKITTEIPAPRHDEPEVREEEYLVLYSIARRAEKRGMMPSIVGEEPGGPWAKFNESEKKRRKNLQQPGS